LHPRRIYFLLHQAKELIERLPPEDSMKDSLSKELNHIEETLPPLGILDDLTALLAGRFGPHSGRDGRNRFHAEWIHDEDDEW
jgi:hypothetical protein